MLAQMKVTKAKGLIRLCCTATATSYGLSKPCFGQAAHLLRFLHHAPRFASAHATRHPGERRGDSLADAKRGEARRVWCSSSPSDELSSAGLCGARVSAHQELTSRRLFERSERSERSEFGAAAKTEQRKAALAQQGPRRQGSLLCLLSCRHKKGGRLPGRNPGAASPENKTRMQARRARGFDTSA